MIENPGRPAADRSGVDDVLSRVLHAIRLSGSLQFCFMPSGAWHTDDKPAFNQMARGGAAPMPFHVVVEGTCWLKVEGREVVLGAGDIVAFPFATGHQLGAGSGGQLVTPVQDLPPKPWRDVPVLRYGGGPRGVRLLCGYLQCDAIAFRPLRDALPSLIHVRTGGGADSHWLRATIAQMVSEVDNPRAGGLSVLERLAEIAFIELLRHHIIAARPGAGWLAAAADPALGRCLGLIHEDPARAWSVASLAKSAGLSRSTLAQRFEAVLGASPMRYVREWRLCLATVALRTTRRNIAAIAYDAGYGTEAAFSRAFARAYGLPPAAWRQSMRAQGA